jgi:hypothetical protein
MVMVSHASFQELQELSLSNHKRRYHTQIDLTQANDKK